MTMSINSVGNGNGGGFDPSKVASLMASRMMSELDPNNTGKVSKDQFVSGLTAKGVSGADATKMYDSIDTKKTGSIDKSDIKEAIAKGDLKPPPGAAKGSPGGAGGAGSPGRAGGPDRGPGKSAQAGGASDGAEKSGGASNSSTTYDAADTNKDGTVSAQESAVYDLKHPSAPNEEATRSDPSKLGKNVDMLV